MKVKTMLYASIFASLIAFLITGAVYLIAFSRINTESANVKRASALTRQMFEANLVMHEYLIYREQRPLVQWKLHSDRISRSYQQMQFLKSENQALLDDIKKNHEAVASSFSELVSSHGRAFPGVSPALVRQMKGRLQSRILVKTHDIFNKAVHIARASEDSLIAIQKYALWGVLAVLFILSLASIGLATFVARSILKPLTKLRVGTESVAEGNLDYQVKTESDNEIGKLSSAFNQMVNDLRSIMISRDELEEVVARRTTELVQANTKLKTEISERERAQEGLIESERRFRAFMDNNPAAASIKNESGQHIYGNRTLFDKFDTSPNEFIGTTTKDFFPRAEAEKIEAYDEAVRTKGVPVETDDWREEWQGQLRWWKEIKFPLAGPAGEKLVGGIGFDITERKQAEEKLQKAFEEIKELKNRLEQENIYLREEIEVRHRHEEIIGKSDAIKKALNQAEQVADTDSTVLILGETGTGKELLARTIHNLSSRKGRPMVKVNCAALPSTLIESELFGREKGAYTGALTKQVGRFEVADGSTIFLDEISELPFDVQAKLLRVLEEGQFERLGSSKTIKVDVRVIAATNRDLAKAVSEGSFREDLYYRLNVFPVTVPPLRDRPEDIPLLVWAFIKEYGEIMGKTIERIPRKNMDALQRYPWPGNIRELRNAIERAMILSKSTTVQVDLPKIPDSTMPQSVTLGESERRHIIKVLESTGWRVSGKKGTALLLGLKPTTLEARMKKLGIQRPR